MICKCGWSDVCLLKESSILTSPIPWSASWSVLGLLLLPRVQKCFQGRAKHTRRWEGMSSYSDTELGYMLSHVWTAPNYKLQHNLDSLYCVNTTTGFQQVTMKKKLLQFSLERFSSFSQNSVDVSQRKRGSNIVR